MIVLSADCFRHGWIQESGPMCVSFILRQVLPCDSKRATIAIVPRAPNKISSNWTSSGLLACLHSDYSGAETLSAGIWKPIIARHWVQMSYPFRKALNKKVCVLVIQSWAGVERKQRRHGVGSRRRHLRSSQSGSSPCSQCSPRTQADPGVSRS